MDDKKLLRGVNILFVEDDEFIGGVITLHLENAGARFFWARGGNEAYDILMKEKFDIVLTDLKMKNGSGIELIKQIKSNQNFVDIPILVLTNLTNEDIEVIDAKKMGVKSFFAKSSTPMGELVRVVACILKISNDCNVEQQHISLIPKNETTDSA